MQTTIAEDTDRYARCIAASKRVRWEIDRDVLRGRSFDRTHKFLPDGLSRVHELTFLDAAEQRLLSQVQGRTYANLFGFIERTVNALVLDVSRDHRFGDQTALESLVRFSDEELKHQELFRRVERLIAAGQPSGYRLLADADEIARVVLQKSTWAVLALVLHVELFTQQHYRESIADDASLSPLFKDVFLFHWKEEAQHAVIDELELRRVDRSLTAAQREQGVADLIALVHAVDGILQVQAAADADWFLQLCTRRLPAHEAAAVRSGVLAAYRWQYVGSGLANGRFAGILFGLVDAAQQQRILRELAPWLPPARTA
jgi:hypothetical protein